MVMVIVGLILFIVSLLIVIAPLFIWNRCNQILEEIKRRGEEEKAQRAKIISLLDYLAKAVVSE